MTELNIIDGPTNNEPIIATTTASVRIRAPKRILHFSDGTLEEYSDDDEDVNGSDKMNANSNVAYNQQVDVVSWNEATEAKKRRTIKSCYDFQMTLNCHTEPLLPHTCEIPNYAFHNV